jgi:phage terminase small subunit
MPALPNPRHERFAQLIFLSLCNGEPKSYSTARAYIAAGYSPKGAFERGGSAQTSSSRLLYRVLHRVRELQAQAAEHTKEDAAKIIRELNEIKMDAKHDRAHAAAVSAVMGKAKVLGIVDKPQDNPQDWNAAQSMQDIGRKLLQSIGYAAPSDADIALAIEANDIFVAELERIRDAAQGIIIDQ